jgi:hypothetical protein
VGEVDRWERDLFAFDVHPNIHLGEVGERENAEVFAGVFASVEKVPKFGALIFWVPLAEVIAVGEEAFFGAGFFFIAASATEAGIVLMFFDGIEEGDGLKFVAGSVRTFFFDNPAGIDGVLNETNDELGTEEFYEFIAVDHGLLKVVTGIDMNQWEGRTCGPEGFFCEPCHHDGIFTAREEKGGVLKLSGGLTEYKDRLGFELVEMGEVIVHFKVKAEMLKN